MTSLSTQLSSRKNTTRSENHGGSRQTANGNAKGTPVAILDEAYLSIPGIYRRTDGFSSLPVGAAPSMHNIFEKKKPTNRHDDKKGHG